MTMSFMQRSLAVVLGVVALSGPVLAQDFKLGFINLDRILKETNSAKASQSKLEQEFSRRERDLLEQRTSFKAQADKFDKDAPTLSESQRVSRQKQLVDLDRELQRKGREFQEDLNVRRNEELQTVLERANRVVRQVAEAEKYDLVLQDAVYINPKHDITEKVIRALNAAPAAAAPAGK